MDYQSTYMFIFVYFPLFVYALLWLVSTIIWFEIKDEYVISKSSRPLIHTILAQFYILLQCFIPLFNILLMGIGLLGKEEIKQRALESFKKDDRLTPKESAD
jgi:hypothetical protein